MELDETARSDLLGFQQALSEVPAQSLESLAQMSYPELAEYVARVSTLKRKADLLNCTLAHILQVRYLAEK